MRMKKIINHLRQKPEKARRDILHLITICFAIILISLWVLSLSATFGNNETKERMTRDLQPFSELKANLSDGYQPLYDKE